MKFICLAIAWMFLLGFIESVLAADIVIYIEAESANEFVKSMGIFKDDKNAWGKYVTNLGDGEARYEIDMPEAVKLYIWGRVRSFDNVSNSFFFKLNEGPEFIWDIPDEGGPFCPNWCWDLIAKRPGMEPFEFDFKRGKNNLYIIAREKKTGLDALYLVLDSNMKPPDHPLPEGIQEAVEIGFQLAETWGKIKIAD